MFKVIYLDAQGTQVGQVGQVVPEFQQHHTALKQNQETIMLQNDLYLMTLL